MTRYINADELIDFVSRFRLDSRERIKAIIDAQPIADVRENDYCENISESGFLCSVCGFGDFDGFHGYKPKYCPNCGRKVRGGQ